MKVLTFSRHFPKGHPRAGEPTWFVERVMAGIAEDYYPNYQMPKDFTQYDWHQYYNCTVLKRHSIRAGSRWKPGDMASLRVWSDKPYRSKQIEFAQVEVKKEWAIEIYQHKEYWEFKLNGKKVGWDLPEQTNIDDFVDQLAANDGLTTPDFLNWFSIHPKKQASVFRGQVICWSDKIDYSPITTGKPDLQTT
jgi:hypothetical protein